MKTVLITNLYLQKYTGSELHAIDMANEFKKHGYDVTIAVFSKSYPLLSLCDDFNVVELSNPCLDNTQYDILFIQHYPTLDYLKTHYHIQYKYLIISKLSSFNGFETLPSLYHDANLISVVSKECQDSISKLTNHTFLFKNSVSDNFFTLQKRNSYTLNNIAIISNHVPNELYELSNLLKDNYNVQFIGAGNAPTLVTPKILSQYDLVITIGRTVQQCFASNIPVYVYDHFGGPGYITRKNIQRAQDFNFSGRGFEQKSTIVLCNEIINQYNSNLNQIQYLHDYAQDNFSLSKTFNSMLEKATQNETNDYIELIPYSEPENTRLKTYSEMMVFTPYIHSDYINESKIYYPNENNDLSEENSIIWNITNEYVIDKHINVTSPSFIRFDPANKPCKCKILEIKVDGKIINQNSIQNNCIIKKDSFDYFLTNDSNYIIPSSVEHYIDIKYMVYNLTYEDMEHITSEKSEEIKTLILKYEQLYDKTHPVHNLNKRIKARRQ